MNVRKNNFLFGEKMSRYVKNKGVLHMAAHPGLNMVCYDWHDVHKEILNGRLLLIIQAVLLCHSF